MRDRREFMRRLAAGGLLAGIPLVIQQALASGRHPVVPGLHRISGSVRVNEKSVAEGMLIVPGDTIRTGPASEAIYVVGRDAYLQRENTTVSLAQEALKGGLRVLAGQVLAVFGKGTRKIQTTTATIGIRGTGCYLEVEPALTYVCLCYGEAEFIPAVAPHKATTLATRHHESPIWISGVASDEPISKAPMRNHTDAELTLLEGLVGRVPPFAQGLTGSPSGY